MKQRKKILVLFFILVFLLTGCTEENKIYKSAIEDYNNKNYLSSMNKFETLGDYKDSKYTIRVKVNTITDDGYIICDADIIDDGGNVYFTVKEVTGGKEPPFMIGTKLARMKIWATVTGKKLGSILKSELPNK